MDPSEIDLSPLHRAIQRLDEGMDLLAREPGNTLLRDGVIQRFEFTYELSHKMLRRVLEARAAVPGEIAGLSFQDLIRVAGERGLLRSSWREWSGYRRARTMTSHTYDEARALEVLGIVPEFAREAQDLLRRLEGGHGGS